MAPYSGPLTANQQLALAKAPPASRGKMRDNFLRQKKGGNGKSGRKPATRSMGEIVLAPGVGRVPSKPFGSSNGSGLRCWDAFDNSHAPLPRSIGPYAVVRTTRIFQSTSSVNVFGVAVGPDGTWSTTCCWSSDNVANPINGINNTILWNTTAPGVVVGAASTFTVVPAAMSVQVMNPNSLQTTSGLVYAAVCPTQLSLIDNTRTWQAFENEFTAYMKPRMMSAPKLALRGVQLNSYPMNMAAMANFEGLSSYADGPALWGQAGGLPRDKQYLTALAPMVVVNTAQVALTYAVTIEWRVRFDISNPAVASHVHHGITTDSKWDSMLQAAQGLGNGVRDIADVVATAGQAFQAVRGMASGI
jgi:hypothetical protein